ncbi:MAG: GNAT family N-acetyltransferase [Leptolyngbyaceae cyanobacterium MAG.088]|nr:GNAT family N-acetyltransferase [Leptolyngbyaceae cyanobacterium MAG.088]
MVRILKRRITSAEASLLVSEIKKTPNIIGYSFQEWIRANNIIVAEEEEGSLIGACLNYDFHKEWRKIAALYVLRDFRGVGVGRKLFYESFDDAQNNRRNIYTISANPSVIKMMDELKLRGFNSFASLVCKFPSYRSLFCKHTIQWITNSYRLQELARKSIFCRTDERFIYGIKIAE